MYPELMENNAHDRYQYRHHWGKIGPLYLLSKHGGLMVSVLDFGANGPGSGPGRGHCVVFLGKTLYSLGGSLHPGV